MRIIAGHARGRRLRVPPGDRVRPTADRVREALFSSLQPHVVGSRVLDLYAGAGSLGLEAASRGAASVTFVERDRRVRAVLDENVRVVGFDAVDIVVGDVGQVLMRSLSHAPFDLVFADPPYDLADATLVAVLHELVAHLAPDAHVIVERSSRSTVPVWPSALRAESSRRYGDTTLHRAVTQPPAEAPRREELR